MKEKPMRPGIYRIRIFTKKPYENVAVWPRKPDVDSALETFREAILTMDADEYFRVEISEVDFLLISIFSLNVLIRR